MDVIAEYILQVSPTHPFLSPESLNIRVVAGRTLMQNPWCRVLATVLICERYDPPLSHSSYTLIHKQGMPEMEMLNLLFLRRPGVDVDSNGDQFPPPLFPMKLHRFR